MTTSTTPPTDQDPAAPERAPRTPVRPIRPSHEPFVDPRIELEPGPEPEQHPDLPVEQGDDDLPRAARRGVPMHDPGADARPGIPHLPGLDGLRALAVGLVVVQHAWPRGLPGGFIGVTAFFVLSGYLITSQLLAEYAATGAVRLRGFWMRRARRLLPAMYVVVAATLVAAIAFEPLLLRGLRAQTLAALTYTTNFQLIASDTPYFERFGAPSPLLHLWSLAVEEQFYLVWPLVLVLLARRRGTLGRVAAVTAAATLVAATFAVAAWALGASPELLYYGTVSNAAPLLAGATLAMVWRPQRLAQLAAPLRRRTVEVVAAGSLVGVLAAAALLTGTGTAFYVGGQLLVSLLVVALLAMVVLPTPSTVGRAFELRPVRWVGTRSYAIYLWHWPLLVLLRGVRPETAPVWTAPLAVLGTLALAEVSWHVVERPLRGLGSGRPFTTRTTVAFGIATAALLVCVAMVLRPQVVTGQWPVREVVDAELAAKGELYGAPQTGNGRVGPGGATVGTVRDGAVTLVRPKGLVTFVGDSVMLGASGGLVKTIGEPVLVDAKVGRYSNELISTVAELERTDRLGPVVVLHVGQNGPFTRADVRQTMEIAGDDRKVFFINSAVGRDWAHPTNDVLLHNLPSYPNARIIDWLTVSQGHPEYFVADGVHLTPDGITAFAELVRAAMFDRRASRGG